MSIPRSLVVVAGAFSRAPHSPDHGAERNSRRRTADHSYHDAQGYISAPPQHAHTHQHRHHEKHHRGQHHGACKPCAHPSPHRLCPRLCNEPDPLRRRAVTQKTALRRCAPLAYYSWAKASRSWFSCSSGKFVEMISKSYAFSSSTTLSTAVTVQSAPM